MEACLMCGCVLQPEQEKRRKRPAALRGMLQGLWRETPLAWAVAAGVVAATEADFSLALCMPCVHWQNRLRRREAAKRELLPMDALLIFLRAPCAVAAPDSRLLRRLAAALSERVTVRGVLYENMYRRLVPVGLLGLLAAPLRRDEFVRRAQEETWRARGCASLIGSREEMRALRRLAAADVDALAEAVLGGGTLFTGVGADG